MDGKLSPCYKIQVGPGKKVLPHFYNNVHNLLDYFSIHLLTFLFHVSADWNILGHRKWFIFAVPIIWGVKTPFCLIQCMRLREEPEQDWDPGTIEKCTLSSFHNWLLHSTSPHQSWLAKSQGWKRTPPTSTLQRGIGSLQISHIRKFTTLQGDWCDPLLLVASLHVNHLILQSVFCRTIIRNVDNGSN